MNPPHLSATFTKELERRVYLDQLPEGVGTEALRHAVARSGVGGPVANYTYVARLALTKLTTVSGPDRAPSPLPPNEGLTHPASTAGRENVAGGGGTQEGATRA